MKILIKYILSLVYLKPGILPQSNKIVLNMNQYMFVIKEEYEVFVIKEKYGKTA